MVAARRGRLLELDLKSHRCSEISMSTDIALDDGSLEKIRGMVERSEQGLEWPWLFDLHYKIGRQTYRLLCYLYQQSQPDRLSFQATYSWTTGPETGNAASAIDMFDALSQAVGTATFVCSATFKYGSGEATSTVSLPIELPVSDRSGKAEIRGVRVTRTGEQGNIEYSIILDRPGNEEYSYAILFEAQSQMAFETPAELLSRAGNIAGSFIRLKTRKRKESRS